MEDKMQWFVVNVHTGCEDKVARGLREQIDKRRLNAYFGEILVPTREITEVKAGKRVKTEKKFFPGYIVVQMVMNNETFSLVKLMPQVVMFLGAKNKPIAVSEEEARRLLKQVEELTGYSLGMVTSIEFQAQNKDGKYDANLNVNYDRVNQILVPKDLLSDNNSANLEDAGSSYTFGEGLTGAFTVAKGDVNTVTDYMLVNINPANAVISNDMLSLVNGKGTNLNEYVNITSEQWSDDIVKTRATQDNGLRLVGVQLKNDVDFEAFDKLVLTKSNAAHDATGCTGEKDEFIAYALSVTDAEKDRTVTSTYDVTLHVTEEGEAKNIDGKTTIKSSAASESDSKSIKDWAEGEDATGTSEKCFPVATGEAFTINVGSDGGRVMASYVVVDYDKEGLTASDKAALKGLEFSGVDTVLKGEELKHSITINGIEGIAVPLKLVTIDYTGKVQVFNIWVKAGAAVTVNAAYTITPKAAVGDPVRFSIDNQDLLQAFTIPAGATKYTVEFTAGETAHEGHNHVPTVYKTSKYNNINMSISELKAVRDDATAMDQINQSFLKLYEADKETLATKLDKIITSVDKENNCISFSINDIPSGMPVDSRIVFPTTNLMDCHKYYNENYDFTSLDNI